MMKSMKWIAAGVLVTVGAQAAIVTDNLKQELNADDIGKVTGGATWNSRIGAPAKLTVLDWVGGELTKAAATVNGGQTSPLVANTLTKNEYSRAGALGATTAQLTGEAFSVELWVSPNFVGTPDSSHTIFETGGPSKGMSITLGDNGSGTKNTLRFAMKDAFDSAFVDVALPSNFSDGDLHQLVVTYDNLNNMSFYIDGALKGSNTTAGVIDWDGSSVAGFWGEDGTGRGAEAIALDDETNVNRRGKGNGTIAVFRHYTDVLTGAEVLQNYSTTAPKPTLLGWAR